MVDALELDFAYGWAHNAKGTHFFIGEMALIFFLFGRQMQHRGRC